ncbi:uncharacterized protein IL334_000935 [Kwoniella shivajii]|uniref:SET domain-containing protein n=1 Tax=Kwoniella shivajii TaxID=564305 RepID=A0ABZ1CQQ1_9TREE|nr:hypothetical protein IL334_000935 [Kwoniella shivajii]
MEGPDLAEEEQKALSVIHQLCAFEFLYMELFASLDGIDKLPARGSKTLRFERDWLYINPRTKEKAKRDDGVEDLEAMIRRITQSQRDAGDNVIPERYLRRIENNFLSALHNSHIRLGISKEIPDEVGLFVKSRSRSNRSSSSDSSPRPMQYARKQPASNSTGTLSRIDYLRRRDVNKADLQHYDIDKPNMKGIRFELFSFPRRVKEIEQMGFLDDLTFDYKHRSNPKGKKRNYILIGLGLARVINHHCKLHSVTWPFESDALRFDDQITSLGYMAGRKLEVSKELKPGMEVFGYYSAEFAKLDCLCTCTDHHPYPRPSSPDSHDSCPPPRNSSPFLRNTEVLSQADSMDMGTIQMEGSKPKHRYSFGKAHTPFNADWTSDTELSEKRKDQLTRTKRKKDKYKKHAVVELDDDEDEDVQYVGTHLSPSKQKKKKRLFIEEEEQQDNDIFIQDTMDISSPILSEPEREPAPEPGLDRSYRDHVSNSPHSVASGKLNPLSERIDDRVGRIKMHEGRLENIIAELVDLKEQITNDRKEIEACRKENSLAMVNSNVNRKGKGKERDVDVDIRMSEPRKSVSRISENCTAIVENEPGRKNAGSSKCPTSQQ